MRLDTSHNADSGVIYFKRKTHTESFNKHEFTNSKTHKKNPKWSAS